MTSDAYDPKRVSAVVAGLVAEREPYEAGWRETDKLVAPGMARLDLGDLDKGDVDDSEIVNSTADQAQEVFENGMVAFTVNPSQPWIRIEPEDPSLARRISVSDWADQVAQVLLDVTEESGTYEQLKSLYGYSGKFANGLLWTEESYRTLVRTRSMAVGSWWIGRDEDAVPSTIFRRFRMSVRRLVETFGRRTRSGSYDWSNFSTEVREAWDDSHYERQVDVGQLVLPNENWKPEYQNAREKRFASCYFELAGERSSSSSGHSYAPMDGRFLREGGYDVFPGLFFPWDLYGDDVYGVRCPGRMCRGDIREVQHWSHKTGAAIDKILDPPLYGPPWAKMLRVGYLPGQVTAVPDSDLQRGGLRKVVEVDPKVLEALDRTERMEKRIERAYHVPLFRMLESLGDATGRTATEIAQRKQESLMGLIGPGVRVNRGVLIPYVQRIYNAAAALGRIPPPPREVEGKPLKIRFVSVMAQAMRSLNLAAIERVLETAAVAVKVDPAAGRNLHVRNLLEEMQRASGAPARILRTEEEIAAMDEADRKAMAMQAQVEQAERLAKTVKTLSDAEPSSESVLGKVGQALKGAGGRR